MKDYDIREITLKDLNNMVDAYIDYFNQEEMASWKKETVLRRFRQLVLREDYFGLGMFDNEGNMIGFAVGAMIQFDDGMIAHLNELFIIKDLQSKGFGSKLLKAFESLAKEKGAFRIQLETTKDDIHHRFYNDYHDYLDTNSNIIKGKQLL